MPVMTTPAPPGTGKASGENPKRDKVLVVSMTGVATDFKNYTDYEVVTLSGVDDITQKLFNSAAMIVVDADLRFRLGQLSNFAEKFDLRQPQQMRYEGPSFAMMLARGEMNHISTEIRNMPLMVVGTEQAPRDYSYMTVPNQGWSHMGRAYAVLNETQMKTATDAMKVFVDNPSKSKPQTLAELRMAVLKIERENGSDGAGQVQP